jgi:hypothetical protein
MRVRYPNKKTNLMSKDKNTLIKKNKDKCFLVGHTKRYKEISIHCYNIFSIFLILKWICYGIVMGGLEIREIVDCYGKKEFSLLRSEVFLFWIKIILISRLHNFISSYNFVLIWWFVFRKTKREKMRCGRERNHYLKIEKIKCIF